MRKNRLKLQHERFKLDKSALASNLIKLEWINEGSHEIFLLGSL